MAARVTMLEFSVCDQRPPYAFGLSPAGSGGGGAESRSELFEAFAARLAEIFGGLFTMPPGEAWAEANEIVEGPGINWVFHRQDGARSFTARGSC